MKKTFLLTLLVALLLPLSSYAAMPEFQTQDLNGKVLTQKDVIGKQPTLLVFWATW